MNNLVVRRSDLPPTEKIDLDHMDSRTGFGEMIHHHQRETILFIGKKPMGRSQYHHHHIIRENSHSRYTQQVWYGSVPGWYPHCQCRYCHHTFMRYKHHVKNTSKQCCLDRLKNGSKRDTNETSTCAVPAHAPQTNALL